jgi:hypothetical protein
VSILYKLGSHLALETLGLKLASKPEMGDAMYMHFVSATGDEGASHGRSHDNPANNASTSFDENQRHVLRDPHNEAHPFPVGGQQSRAEYKSASNYYESDYQRPEGSGPGPTHNQTPGDYLGYPQSQANGTRLIVGGNPVTPRDKVDRQFKSNDEVVDSRVMEGSNALPDGPTV